MDEKDEKDEKDENSEALDLINRMHQIRYLRPYRHTQKEFDASIAKVRSLHTEYDKQMYLVKKSVRQRLDFLFTSYTTHIDQTYINETDRGCRLFWLSMIDGAAKDAVGRRPHGKHKGPSPQRLRKEGREWLEEPAGLCEGLCQTLGVERKVYLRVIEEFDRLCEEIERRYGDGQPKGNRTKTEATIMESKTGGKEGDLDLQTEIEILLRREVHSIMAEIEAGGEEGCVAV